MSSATAIDGEETNTSPTKSTNQKNAFSELMSPKPKVPLEKSTRSHISKNRLNPQDLRLGLLGYINNPTSYPSQLISYDADFVLIRDLYPKATIHLLLMSRNPSKYLEHPHNAFADPTFLTQCKTAAASAATLATKELQRLLGQYSATEAPRRAALENGDEVISPGRDWGKEIRVGIHAHPSMAHLHIHIISRDMVSECLKHRRHYSSFNTDFFIPLADYPLAEDDVRRSTPYQNNNIKNVDFTCWRCGRGFGNRFQELKRHLEEEFKAWRQE